VRCTQSSHAAPLTVVEDGHQDVAQQAELHDAPDTSSQQLGVQPQAQPVRGGRGRRCVKGCVKRACRQGAGQPGVLSLQCTHLNDTAACTRINAAAAVRPTREMSTTPPPAAGASGAPAMAADTPLRGPRADAACVLLLLLLLGW
jgi:hypothetical protein